ncbi:MAG: CHAT domain-containing protein [Symploca sp. SIO2E6]|nr:CHAT domain-containing protein [Symploca sp. SIO2E6]
MTKLVTIKLGEGSWKQGFPVILQIAEEGSFPYLEIPGRLPSAPEIPQYYDQWQSSYRHLPTILRLTAPAAQITNVSTTADCRQTLENLRDSLNRWLHSESFRPLRDRLLQNLSRSESIRFIIQARDSYVQRLPWHLTELFEEYTESEVAIGALLFEPIVQQNHSFLKKIRILASLKKIRILAILGNSEGINVTADRQFLENLPGAETFFLVEPPQREISKQLWEQHWDIFFFAGHSHTEGEVGRIYINQTESLTIGELKDGLRTAIASSLQLAIFNSCDGLGLAKELEKLQIPQAIVMREPVPDLVAQEFLKHFLKAFSSGKSLYVAVRTARGRLAEEGLERELPGVRGLPIIFQNPAATPLVWFKKKPSIAHQRKLIIAILALVGILILVSIIAQTINFYQLYDPSKEQLNAPIQIPYPNNWKIKYPKNWQVVQGELITGEVVKFVVMEDNSSDSAPASVIVNIEFWKSPITLEEYTEKTVTKISQELTSDSITPVSSNLAGLEATKIVYTQQQQNQEIKLKQFWTLKDNHVYIVTYQAEVARFSEFEEVAQKIIDSFTFD